MSRIDSATKELFRDPMKRRAWVHYQLGLQGRTLASVGREVGVTRGSMYYALVKPYPRIERAIAEAVDVPVHELFPERYDQKTGERLIRMGRRPRRKVSDHDLTNHSNDSRSETCRDRQDGEAA